MPSWLQNLKDKYGEVAFAAVKKVLVELLDNYLHGNPDVKQIKEAPQPKELQGKTYDLAATVTDTKGLLMRMCRGVVAKGTLSVLSDGQVFQTMSGDINVTLTPTSISDDDGDPFMPSMTGKVIGKDIGPIPATISGCSVAIKGSNDSSQWDGNLQIAPNWGMISGQVKITGSVANLTVELKATRR